MQTRRDEYNSDVELQEIHVPSEYGCPPEYSPVGTEDSLPPEDAILPEFYNQQAKRQPEENGRGHRHSRIKRSILLQAASVLAAVSIVCAAFDLDPLGSDFLMQSAEAPAPAGTPLSGSPEVQPSTEKSPPSFSPVTEPTPTAEQTPTPELTSEPTPTPEPTPAPTPTPEPTPAPKVVAQGHAGSDVSWELTEDGHLSFTGTGAMDDYEDSEPVPGSPIHTDTGIPVTSISIGEGITRIGNFNFMFCDTLKEVSLPSTLTSLGNFAFSSCTSLETVELPDSLTELGSAAFDGCTSLTHITIPGGVGTIQSHTFYDCTSLSEVTLMPGITQVDYWAFRSCTALTNIEMPEGVTTVSCDAFDQSGVTALTLPSTIEVFEPDGRWELNLSLTDIYYVGTREQYEAWKGDPAAGLYGAAVHIMG